MNRRRTKNFLQETIWLFIAIYAFGIHSQAQKTTGFVAEKYIEVSVNAIKPKGWLLNQLKIMRDGTTGHLDEVYNKIKNDNGWLGGKGDGWEETPYWLDGAVPLAYLLDDKDLKEKVLPIYKPSLAVTG